MAMQTNWYDLIPFYVARTLPSETMQAFDAALNDDAALRREVQEWRIIASAVWQETDQIAQQLPPLQPDIYEKLAYRRPFAGGTQAALTPDYAAHPGNRRGVSRGIRVPITLVAGLGVVVLVGALLILAANNRAKPLEVAAAATMTGTTSNSGFAAAATLTAEQVMTQLAFGTVQPPVASPTNTLSAEPTQLPITTATLRPNLPVQPTTENLSIAGIAATTPTLYVPPGLPSCFVTNQQPDAIAIYDAARRDGNIIGQVPAGEARVVFQTTLDNWYNIFTVEGLLRGWVAFDDVVLSGDCLGLPQPTVTMLPTPTALLTSVAPETFVIVTDVFADVRTGPGLEFTVMMAVPRDNTLRVLGSTGVADVVWYYVELPDAQQGWVWNQQVSISEISGFVPATFTPLATPSPDGQ